MSNVPILIVHNSDLFNDKKDYFCQLMVEYEWLPRVTPHTLNEAEQIMLDHYNIITHKYSDQDKIKSLKGDEARESRLAFRTALQTHQPDICLFLGSRIARLSVAGLKTSEQYGNIKNMTHDDSKKLTKFYVMPCTKRGVNIKLTDLKSWFGKFLEFLNDEYN